jgi:hypothetical protein
MDAGGGMKAKANMYSGKNAGRQRQALQRKDDAKTPIAKVRVKL